MDYNNDAELHMFEYFVMDKGFEVAVEDYYPNLFDKNDELRFAYAQYKCFKEIIMKKVNELSEQTNDDH